jgi:hypothetical protein
MSGLPDLSAYKPNGNWLDAFVRDPSAISIAASEWMPVASYCLCDVQDKLKPNMPRGFYQLSQLLVMWSDERASVDASCILEFADAVDARLGVWAGAGSRPHWRNADSMQGILENCARVIQRIKNSAKLRVEKKTTKRDDKPSTDDIQRVQDILDLDDIGPNSTQKTIQQELRKRSSGMGHKKLKLILDVLREDGKFKGPSQKRKRRGSK